MYTSATFDAPLYPSFYAFIIEKPASCSLSNMFLPAKKSEKGEALQKQTSLQVAGRVLVDLARRLAIEAKEIEPNAVASSHQQRN